MKSLLQALFPYWCSLLKGPSKELIKMMKLTAYKIIISMKGFLAMINIYFLVKVHFQSNPKLIISKC